LLYFHAQNVVLFYFELQSYDFFRNLFSEAQHFKLYLTLTPALRRKNKCISFVLPSFFRNFAGKY